MPSLIVTELLAGADAAAPSLGDAAADEGCLLELLELDPLLVPIRITWYTERYEQTRYPTNGAHAPAYPQQPHHDRVLHLG
jgi:hypothetical protein